MSLKREIIEFIQYYAEINNGRPPTKKTILDSVPGVHNNLFYQFFKSVKAAHQEAGITQIDTTDHEAEELEKRLAKAFPKKTVNKFEKPDPRTVSEQISTVMRVLGEQDPKRAMTRACKIVSEYSRCAFLYGIQRPEEINSFFADQLQEMREISQQASDLVQKYTDRTDADVLMTLGVTEETLGLLEFVAKQKGISPNYSKTEIGLLNGIVKAFCSGAPYFVKVIGIPPIRGQGGPTMRLVSLSDREIKDWHYQNS